VDLPIFADVQLRHFQQGHDSSVLPLVSHTPPYRFGQLNFKDLCNCIHGGGMDFWHKLLSFI
jgi:hypothetical protein